MVTCFLCLVTLSKKCASFNILKSHGTHSKTKYGDLIGKLLDDQKLVITISDDNFICETCNTLINAFDRHLYEENVIKQILSRQVGSSYLENKKISLSIDDEALTTFDKHSDHYQCRQCISFKTNKIEFVAAHYKAHQCKLNETRSIVKSEIDDDNDQEMPIEEILLNPACKYENVGDDDELGASSSELYLTGGENFGTNQPTHERKKRRLQRTSNAVSTLQAPLPKYLKDIVNITKTPSQYSDDASVSQVDRLFEIEIPQFDTVGISFTCKICLRKFLHPLKLASHLLTHRDVKYSCKHCPFTVSLVVVDQIDGFKFNVFHRLATTKIVCLNT